jgi:hypothetical protein
MLINPRTVALMVAIACMIAAQGAAIAQPGHPQIIILQIDSVLAADTNQGVDPQLGTMGPRLQKLFNYTTYHLVSEQNGRTEMGKMIEFTMPGGRILHIEPHSCDGNMIAMEVLLFQGEKPMLTTDLKLPNKGRLIVGGPRYQQGALIITIGADMATETVAAPAAVTTAAQPK